MRLLGPRKHRFLARLLGVCLSTLVAAPVACKSAPTLPPHPEEAPAPAQPSSAKLRERIPLSIGIRESLDSAVLGETRTLNILLPADYEQETGADKHHYPVIYLLDGSADEDFLHIAGLVSFLTMYQLMPPSIVVGIGNVDRYRDFTRPPSRSLYKKRIPTSGGSAKFLRFLEQEVQPHIVANYRTGGERTLIGQSLGGLVATQILVERPELFDQYIIVSPSLWWNDEALLDQIGPFLATHPQLDTKLVLALGHEPKMMHLAMDRLVETLQHKAPDSLHWHHLDFPEESHATILHRATYQAFERLYGDQYPGL